MCSHLARMFVSRRRQHFSTHLLQAVSHGVPAHEESQSIVHMHLEGTVCTYMCVDRHHVIKKIDHSMLQKAREK
jgi:hypothetical protein